MGVDFAEGGLALGGEWRLALAGDIVTHLYSAVSQHVVSSSNLLFTFAEF